MIEYDAKVPRYAWIWFVSKTGDEPIMVQYIKKLGFERSAIVVVELLQKDTPDGKPKRMTVHRSQVFMTKEEIK